jgi:hypothetical protein
MKEMLIAYPKGCNVICVLCKRNNIENDIYFNHCSHCKYDLCFECEINNYALMVEHIESTDDLIENHVDVDTL